jgi:hypothetical protein
MEARWLEVRLMACSRAVRSAAGSDAPAVGLWLNVPALLAKGEGP